MNENRDSNHEKDIIQSGNLLVSLTLQYVFQASFILPSHTFLSFLLILFISGWRKCIMKGQKWRETGPFLVLWPIISHEMSQPFSIHSFFPAWSPNQKSNGSKWSHLNRIHSFVWYRFLFLKWQFNDWIKNIAKLNSWT